MNIPQQRAFGRVLIVPQAGRTVPDPATGSPLPAEGRVVTIQTDNRAYWLRRASDGSVALRTPPAPPTLPPAPAAAAEPAKPKPKTEPKKDKDLP